MSHPEPVARRLFELTEPISLVNFFSPEPNDSMAALGLPNYWAGYFAGRSAPLGRVPAEVVHAAFYSFADGEVARHIPKVWDTTTPEAAHAARHQGCVAALRRILGDLVETPELARAAELLAKASTSAPTEGRVMYAGLRTLPMPEEPVARLWHAANMLREHRGDGHIVALVSERIGGTAAHVLSALAMGIYPAESFGRIHHLPESRLAEVIEGLRDRGLLDGCGRLTDAGRATKDRIESLTDALAEAPYEGLEPAEVDELIVLLEPIARRLEATGSNSEAVGRRDPHPKLVELSDLLVGTWRVEGPDIKGTAEYRAKDEGRLLVAYVDFTVGDSKMRVIQHITHHEDRGNLQARYLDTMGDEATYTWVLEDRTIRVSLGEESSDTYFQATLNEDNSQYVGTWHYPEIGPSDQTERIVYTRVADNG